jgi:hypothetical protein|tara:strand:- start:2936 stop:3364 length:429 start_codon:yes stop_codon:yes gene_type:complete
MNSKELISSEFDKLTEQIKSGLDNVKVFAVAEAWKLLQVMAASLIQIVEKIGTDLSSPEKKELSLKLISDFYDKVFVAVDIPIIPNIIEPLLHKSVKAFLMILVGSTIDALVTTFRQTGIFIKKQIKGDGDYSSQILNIRLP